MSQHVMALTKVINRMKYQNLMSACVIFNTKYNSPAIHNRRHNGCISYKSHYSTDEKKLLYDVVVIGGGIVGVATARELIHQYPWLKLAVLEKENKLAMHQTGHNSGVIHAGIYYKPGSLKAELCVKGLGMMYKYCDYHRLPYHKCGKLIVATNQEECSRLDDLIERGKKNNVPDMKVLSSDGIRKMEPSCLGRRAIWSPHTGIINFARVTERFGEEFEELGGTIHLNFKVECFNPNKNSECESEQQRYPIQIIGDNQYVKASYVIVCAGLHSDKLAVMTGCSKDPKIVPIRGEYLLLNENKAHLVNGNIYPVPNPKYPFLGVHFTPRMDGSVWLGPNAVLAFKREGYRWTDFSIVDFFDAVTYPGFLKLAFKNAKFGYEEMLKSIFIKKQVRELQKFIPCITSEDVVRGPAGVRAQALDNKGNLVDDFVFDVNKKTEIGKRVLHCRNAPSPGATSSLAIAELIVERATNEFSLTKL